MVRTESTENIEAVKEEYNRCMTRVWETIEKHGIQALMRAINYLDIQDVHEDSDMEHILDCVCEVFAAKKNKSKHVFRKELFSQKRNDFGVCRNLCILFVHKYCKLSLKKISIHFSRKRRDYAYEVRKNFKAMNRESNLPFEREFFAIYDECDNKLKEHFKV